jgi:hypothetical protein
MMNNTNRGVNRTILLIVGLLLTAGGAAVILARTWPEAGNVWSAAFTTSIETLQRLDADSSVPGLAQATWLGIGIDAVLVVVIVVAVIVLTCLGGGSGGAVLTSDSGRDTRNTIVIEQGFASDALTQTLERHEEILSARVRARRIRGNDVMHVTVTPRKNTSPAEVATTVGTLIANLETLVGRELPALVSIKSGIRSRLASDQSRVA